MKFIKVTEQESNHKDLEKKSVIELVNAMHEEDNNALKAYEPVSINVSTSPASTPSETNDAYSLPVVLITSFKKSGIV